uniref:C2H2-type domain-containing protein n=1 Tax=Meloidogyne javanica TaxID=6303 RepID=A0A915LR05_MELJA
MDEHVKVQCEICNMVLPYARMPIHLKECRAIRTFPCNLCPRFFQSQAGVNKHQGQVHSADERGTAFRCQFPEPKPMDQQPTEQPQQENQQQALMEEVQNLVMGQNDVPLQNDVPKVGARATPIHMDHNIEQSCEDLAEEAPTCSAASGTEPPLGIYDLRLIDPTRARLIMAEEQRDLDDIVRNLRENNHQLRRYCEDHGIGILEHDVIGEQIEAYMREFSVSD